MFPPFAKRSLSAKEHPITSSLKYGSAAPGGIKTNPHRPRRTKLPHVTAPAMHTEKHEHVQKSTRTYPQPRDIRALGAQDIIERIKGARGVLSLSAKEQQAMASQAMAVA